MLRRFFLALLERLNKESDCFNYQFHKLYYLNNG
jgi:hypothetical protein